MRRTALYCQAALSGVSPALLQVHCLRSAQEPEAAALPSTPISRCSISRAMRLTSAPMRLRAAARIPSRPRCGLALGWRTLYCATRLCSSCFQPPALPQLFHELRTRAVCVLQCQDSNYPLQLRGIGKSCRCATSNTVSCEYVERLYRHGMERCLAAARMRGRCALCVQPSSR